MAKTFVFSGDELELLVALDRIGAVLTDDGTFYCDLENEKLSMRNRLPARIRGRYVSCGQGWKITYRVGPAPRTVLIGVVLAVLFLASLCAFALTDGSLMGSGMFGILLGAMAVNYAAQYNACMKRFENSFLHKTDFDL